MPSQQWVTAYTGTLYDGTNAAEIISIIENSGYQDLPNLDITTDENGVITATTTEPGEQPLVFNVGDVVSSQATSFGSTTDPMFTLVALDTLTNLS